MWHDTEGVYRRYYCHMSFEHELDQWHCKEIFAGTYPGIGLRGLKLPNKNIAPQNKTKPICPFGLAPMFFGKFVSKN